jgi:hypothetical protein
MGRPPGEVPSLQWLVRSKSFGVLVVFSLASWFVVGALVASSTPVVPNGLHKDTFDVRGTQGASFARHLRGYSPRALQPALLFCRNLGLFLNTTHILSLHLLRSHLLGYSLPGEPKWMTFARVANSKLSLPLCGVLAVDAVLYVDSR